MRMNNFKVYSPEVKAFGEGVQYFQDEKGRDFYESRGLFKKKYVVFFDEHGIVRGWAKSEEVTRLHPGGLSVIDLNTLPKEFSLQGGVWSFNGKQVVKADYDPVFTTEVRKAGILQVIGSVIAPLQDAVELGEATEEETEKYNHLRRMRVKVMRIPDSTCPADIDWSEFTV